MRHRLLPSVSKVCFSTLLVLALCETALSDPPRITKSGPFSASSSTAVESVLQEGRALELRGRWSEALSHYENAVRNYPENVHIRQRFGTARLQYDIERRYNDRSFCNSLVNLSCGEVLDLYSEVLLKIQAHYIDEPDWKELVQRGSDGFEIALKSETFLRENDLDFDPRTTAAFSRMLRQSLDLRTIETRSDARRFIATVASMAEQHLQIRPTIVVLEYLCGATNSLDLYSAYLTPDQLNDVYSQIEGNFVGLGIELKAQNDALVIVRVIPGSPAQRSGIRAGDQIFSVDGQPTCYLSTDKAASLLQGKIGTTAELVLGTSGIGRRLVRVRRQRVEVPSISDVKIVDSSYGIAYIKLTCFQKTTCRDLDIALWKLHREGMKKLIIDLRGNPGGLLTTAVEIADKFVEQGTIVSTRGRSIQEGFKYSAHSSGTWRVPLVVLIDDESASAAEIFAGAIQDHRRGAIVGCKSYGKGSVQGIFPLNVTTAGIRLTTAKFYSPSGRPFSQVGVEPDIVVHKTAKPVSSFGQSKHHTSDTIMAAGLRVARQQGNRLTSER